MQAVWPDTVAQETRERLLRALAIERETPELRRCFLKLDDEFQPLRAGDDVRELPLEVRDPLQARIGRGRFGAAPPSVHTMCSSISTLAALESISNRIRHREGRPAHPLFQREAYPPNFPRKRATRAARR